MNIIRRNNLKVEIQYRGTCHSCGSYIQYDRSEVTLHPRCLSLKNCPVCNRTKVRVTETLIPCDPKLVDHVKRFLDV